MAGPRGQYTQASTLLSQNTAMLADVNVSATDKIWFWDVSTRQWKLLAIGAGLVINGTTLESTGAPSDAEYIVAAANATLTAERVATNTNSTIWDFATASQAKVSVRQAVSAKTADYTVLTTDTNTIFTNTGSAKTVVFDLPDSASCVAGQTTYTFFSLASRVISVDLTNAADVLYGYDPVGGRFEASLGSPVNSSGFKGDGMTVTYVGTNVWMAMCSGSWVI